MTDAPYPRVHVVINPASGKDEPILNTLNDVFREHGVEWDVSVTHKYGDAAAQALAAIANGVDLVAGYGGDGTQHEVANAVVHAARHEGREVVMGVLPGGTGNGFARELGVPGKLRDAVVAPVHQPEHPRHRRGPAQREPGPGGQPVLHPARLRGRGARGADEPRAEGQVRRLRLRRQHGPAPRRREALPVHRRSRRRDRRGRGHEGLHHQLGDDGHRSQDRPTRTRSTTACSTASWSTRTTSTRSRPPPSASLHLPAAGASKHFRQARAVSLDAEPDQPIWADGEYVGRTPVKVDVLPGALRIVVA